MQPNNNNSCPITQFLSCFCPTKCPKALCPHRLSLIKHTWCGHHVFRAVFQHHHFHFRFARATRPIPPARRRSVLTRHALPLSVRRLRKVGEMCDIHPSIPTHARLALSPCNSIIPIRRAEQNSACNEKTGNTKRTLDFASSLRRAFPVPNDSDEAQSQHLP